jgi:hypothetical protein
MEHPASHNWPMEMSDSDLSSGTMCTWRAVAGRFGMSSSASYGDCMMDPFGLRMLIGLDVRRLLIMRASIVQKLCVLPVSAIAMVLIAKLGGSLLTFDIRLQLGWAILSITLSCFGNDFPPCQLPCNLRRTGRVMLMTVEPPCMLKTVAVSMCPLALWRQVPDSCLALGLNPCVQQ